MIVVNMWFIRHSNGLFHYGLDYTEALGASVREIWVRAETLAQTVLARIPTAKVRVLTRKQLLAEMIRAHRQEELVFTPSAHPVAFMRRQVVVVHDSFPFTGRTGAIKLALFRMALTLSRSAVAYINRSDGLRFLKRCGVEEARMRYLPNHVGGPVPAPPSGVVTIGRQIVVGLFGSDSSKKNYDALFAAVRAGRQGSSVSWRIFGHHNAYTERLRAAYPELAIEVVGSDSLSMPAFIRSIDIAVSVAEGEGFARPVALALMSGCPTFLLDTPVFREFYTGSAEMFETPAALVAALAALRPGQEMDRPQLACEYELRRDFYAGVAWLETC
ncbi:hypothetical protein [Sphingomonas kyungheensis]|uniref:Glycosyl transferase family 1 domain-containing protein n=1 Tax=Sphingomonas kyungheensis TaxID=1069987 RepID=A0ABU8H4J6_9SPHN